MAVGNISGAGDMSKKIQSYANDCGTSDRKERIKLLDKVCDDAKDLIKNLNNADGVAYEIGEEYDEVSSEITDLEIELETATEEVEEQQEQIEELTSQIEDTESLLDEDGEFTEETRATMDELAEYYDVLGVVQGAYDDNNDLIDDLTGDLDYSYETMNYYNDSLDDLSTKMNGYKKAGDEIKNAANKYGKQSMNPEKALERNEKSWWRNVGQGFLNLNAINPMMTTASTLGNMAISDHETQMEAYVREEGLKEVSHQTFYDDSKHEFESEFDVQDDNNKNEIEGKLRRRTASAWSRGSTIGDASGFVKAKADNTKKQ